MNAATREFALEIIEKQAAYAKADPKDAAQAAYAKGLEDMYNLIASEGYTNTKN